MVILCTDMGGIRYKELIVPDSHRLIVCILSLAIWGTSASGQSPGVTLSLDEIVRVQNGFRVSGRVGCSGPESGGGAGHSYTVKVLAEIMDADDAEYPKLAEYLIIRTPAGAETSLAPGSGAEGTLTRRERDGLHITTFRLGGLGILGETEFEGVIPAEYAGKPCRIRAELNYQFNHVNAAWPAIRFFHAEGSSGNLPISTQVHIVDPDKSDVAGNLQTPGKKPGYSPAQDIPQATKTSNTASDGGTPSPDGLPPDFPKTLPKGEIMGTVGHAGEGYDKPISGLAEADEIFATVLTDVEVLSSTLENLNAQLNSGRLTPEQEASLIEDRDELAHLYHDALIAEAEYEAIKIWSSYIADTTFTLADSVLTYHPATGSLWTKGKMVVDLAKGDLLGFALNATTLLNKLHVPKTGTVIPEMVIEKAGTKSQLLQDYIKMISKILPASSSGYVPQSTGCVHAWTPTTTMGGPHR